MSSSPGEIVQPGNPSQTHSVGSPAAGPTQIQPGPARRRAERFPGLTPFASVAYRYMFVGTALTMTGNFMQQVAQGWLIYDLTDSPSWLGLASFARGLPMLVLALPGGVLVDRFDRRAVLITGQGLTALLAVGLSVLISSGRVEPWHVVVTAFLGGSLFVLIPPARQALVVTTVERSQFAAALRLLSAGQNSGRVVGPSLAGLMIAAFGVATSFAVQAGGFVLALLCCWRLSPQPPSSSARQHSAVQNLVEGLRYVWTDPTVRGLIVLQAIPALLLAPHTQLLPIFTRDILKAGPEGLGTLMASMGVGSMLGSLSIVVLPARRQGPYLFVALAAFGLLLAAFAASTWLPLSVGLMGLIGVAQSIYLATNNTLVQLTVPNELRGRVMSVYMATWGLMPLGALPQGFLADWFGAPIVTAGTGLLSFLVVLVMVIRLPAIWKL